MTSSLQHDTTTAAKNEWRSGQEVGNLRWAIGYRTNRLGEYLLKLGDRICGDKPMGIAELMDLGEQIGRRRALTAEIQSAYEQLDDGRKQQLVEYAQQLLAEQLAA